LSRSRGDVTPTNLMTGDVVNYLWIAYAAADARPAKRALNFLIVRRIERLSWVLVMNLNIGC